MVIKLVLACVTVVRHRIVSFFVHMLQGLRLVCAQPDCIICWTQKLNFPAPRRQGGATGTATIHVCPWTLRFLPANSLGLLFTQTLARLHG